MGGASVSEVRRYPLRPSGFEEPLFLTRRAKREILEHLAAGPWLHRASERARGRREPVAVLGRGDRVELIRCGRRGARRSLVVRVLERWREVARWWEGERGTDRLLFRVLLAGEPGAVVDLALERGTGWVLVGIVD